MNEEQQTCPVQVSDSGRFPHFRFPHFHRCGRPVKRDGLCGLHASAKERAAAKQSARRASVEPALQWFTCTGREEDPHEEVRWQGGPHCWVCGQPGVEAVPPRLSDQSRAPYGWT